MAQLVRAPPCHGGGREFESLLGRLYGIIAQLGEHLPYKQRVIGSSPIVSTRDEKAVCAGLRCRRLFAFPDALGAALWQGNMAVRGEIFLRFRY